jgi:TonB family protein
VLSPGLELAEDPSSAAWGDRYYVSGGEGELPSIRTEVVENFDGETGWSCSLGSEEGLGTVRSFATSKGRALGLRVEFLRRASASLLLSPPRPIAVEATCIALSVRVFARNFRHELSFVVLDYYGRAYELPLGRLNFSGWKSLSAYIPRPIPGLDSGIVQDDRHYTEPAGLRIAALKIDFDPDEAYGFFFAYFDDIEATIESLGPSDSASSLGATMQPPAIVPELAPAEPPEAPLAAPSAAPQPVDPAIESSRILSELLRRIKASLTYPAAARRRGLEGTVVAEFTVEKGGELGTARVAQSSGSDLLDAAGLELLRSVFPVQNDSGQRLLIRIAIAYRLTPH